MIGVIEQTLQHQGVADNTYIVFSSDNGLHTGEYRLMPGKLTAFDTDIHVPARRDRPGVPARVETSAVAENIDLAKTFARSEAPRFPATATACWRCGTDMELPVGATRR